MTTTTHIDFTRVFDVLDYQLKKYPQQKAISGRLNGTWYSYSINEIKARANALSIWMLNAGLQKGDTIAIVPLMGNPHWMILDFACQQIGVITVPLHPTCSDDELKQILLETEPKLAIAGNEALWERLFAAKEKCPSLQFIYHLERGKKNYFNPLEQQLPDNSEAKLTALRDQVQPTDSFVILYTSGSSGIPKGIELTHSNVVSNIKSILPILPLTPGDAVLSFLPFSHIFERTSTYAYVAFGVGIHFAESRNSLTEDFKKVRPVFCTCVPKTLERMYDYLQEQQMRANFLQRKIIGWAMALGEQYSADGKVRPLFGLQLVLARVLVLQKWRKALGGKLKYAVVGAAALRPEIGRLFSAAGVKVLAGYGMTEASPFISVNRPEPGLNKFGTVGIAVAGVEVKIDEPNELGEGELLIRGDNVMKGYYKRADLTKQVFKDGWLRTGDVGTIVHDRFIVITDRKKDIFKTSAGIYVAPQVVENKLNASAFIAQSMVVGFNRPFVAALVVPHFAVLAQWCAENGIHWTSPTYMVHNIKVIQKIQEEVDRINKTLETHQRVRGFVLCDMEWTADNTLLTPSFKLIRANLLNKYCAELSKLYGD